MDKARKAEGLGYSTLLIADHLGAQLAPVPALQLAAEATTSLRVGTFVCNNDFRHPVLLAMEAATLDVLTGGRFELGIGAGHARPEYLQAGIAYDAPGVRVERLGEAVRVIKGLFGPGPMTFSGRYYQVHELEGFPRPFQQPHPPIVVGGGGRRLLSLAGREADVVAVGFRVLADGTPDLASIASEATAQQVEWVRQVAGARFDALELNILIQAVVVTDDRQGGAEQVAGRLGVTAAQALETPHALVGTADQIADDLRARRERFGISYVAVFERDMDAFAPVVGALAGT
jgi:probable F420-dependent oxidoreductase